MRTPANPITTEILSYFYYDETSPSCLRWKFTRWAIVGIGPGKRLVVSKDDVAGHLRADGYWTLKLFCQSIKAHRVIYCMFNGTSESENVIVDHEDGNSSNNRIDNLRASTDALNGKNKGQYKNNNTGTTGVHVNEKSPGKFYYVATWRTIDQKIGAKSFSFNKYGQAGALQKACEHRQMMLDMLKAEGIGYTERHGT